MDIFLILKTAVLIVFSLVFSIQDIKTFKISRSLFLPSVIFILLNNRLFYPEIAYLYIISAILLAVLYAITRKLTKNRFGFGDVAFGLFQGLFLQPKHIWICLAVEVLTAIIFVLVKKIKQKELNLSALRLPFIPFMAAGLITAYVLSFFI